MKLYLAGTDYDHIDTLWARYFQLSSQSIFYCPCTHHLYLAIPNCHALHHLLISGIQSLGLLRICFCMCTIKIFMRGQWPPIHFKHLSLLPSPSIHPSCPPHPIPQKCLIACSGHYRRSSLERHLTTYPF